MAEYPVLPTDYDKIDWAEGGTYSVTDPGGAKRLSGWQPENEPVPGPGEIIPAPQSNWLQQLVGRMLTYFLAGAIRMFSDIHEALDAGLVYPQVCLINPGMARGTNIFDVAGAATSGTAILPASICTDGRRCYYIGGTGPEAILAVAPADGATIWEEDPSGGASEMTACCTDGLFLYYTTGSPAMAGLRSLYCVDGASGPTGGAAYSALAIATNGSVAVMIAGAIVTMFTAVQTAPTQYGTQPNLGANASCLAIDADTVYIGGARNTYDVWAYNLADMTLKWGATIAASATNIPRAIFTDGDFVWVATDLQTSVNLVIINRVTGAIVFEGAVSNEDLNGLCGDDQYLYASNVTSDDIYILRKTIPDAAADIIVGKLTTSRTVACCDGISIYSYQSSTGNLTRDLMGRSATHFQIAETDNPDRRPFHHVAIPAGR